MYVRTVHRFKESLDQIIPNVQIMVYSLIILIEEEIAIYSDEQIAFQQFSEHKLFLQKENVQLPFIVHIVTYKLKGLNSITVVLSKSGALSLFHSGVITFNLNYFQIL